MPGWVLAVALLSAAALWFAVRAHLQRRLATHAGERLLAAARPPPGPVARGRPAVVQAWLERVAGAPGVARAAELSQAGTIRLAAGATRWHALSAAHFVTAWPPAYLWQARVRIAPLVDLTVLDGYQQGQGAQLARLAGLFRSLDLRGDGPLAEAQLLRWLAESVWWPDVLAHGALDWEPAGGQRATANLAVDGVCVSALFEFGAGGVPRRVQAARPRRVDGAWQRTDWSVGYHGTGNTRAGHVPDELAAVWHGDAGDFEYCRLRLLSRRVQGEAA